MLWLEHPVCAPSAAPLKRLAHWVPSARGVCVARIMQLLSCELGVYMLTKSSMVGVLWPFGLGWYLGSTCSDVGACSLAR